jgi:hypothetical protein
MNRVIWHIMTKLVGWASPLTPTSHSSSEEELLNDWQWMLSAAEEISLRQLEKERGCIQNEVESLKRITSSLGHRKILAQKIVEYWSRLPRDDQILLSTKTLDACKRDRLLRDVIKTQSNNWLSFLEAKFNLGEQFSQNWHQEKYKKNTVGEIVCFAFTASNAGVYTEKTCTDILWSVYLCLSRAVSQALNRTLTSEEQNAILSLTDDLPHMISDLWLQTLKNMGAIEERAGSLPQLWKERDEQKKKQLEAIKATGASARYNDGPNDALRQQQLSRSVIVNPSKDTVAEKRDFLSKSLILRQPKR